MASFPRVALLPAALTFVDDAMSGAESSPTAAQMEAVEWGNAAVDTGLSSAITILQFARDSFPPHLEKLNNFTLFRNVEDVRKTRGAVIAYLSSSRGLYNAVADSDKVFANQVRLMKLSDAEIKVAVDKYRRRNAISLTYGEFMRPLDEEYFAALLNLVELASSRFGYWTAETDDDPKQVPRGFRFLTEEDAVRYRYQMGVVARVSAQEKAVRKSEQILRAQDTPSPLAKQDGVFSSSDAAPIASPAETRLPDPVGPRRPEEKVSGQGKEFPPMPQDYEAQVKKALQVDGKAEHDDFIRVEPPRRGYVKDPGRQGMDYHFGWIVVAIVRPAAKPVSDADIAPSYFMFAEGRMGDVTGAFTGGFAGYTTD